MAQVRVTTSRTVAAAPDQVLAALSDYVDVRPKILPAQFRDYAVLAGGDGAGTRAHWVLQATSRRSRDVLAEVTVRSDGTLIETDKNSTMVTTWSVRPGNVHGASDAVVAGSTVELTTTWNGAGGIGGFFERTFAPKGLTAIYDDLLARLDTYLTAAA